MWFSIVVGLVLAILVARFFHMHHEALVVGGMFLGIEAYKFYLQPHISFLPAMPSWLSIMVGAYIITGALLIILRFVPGFGNFVRMITNG